MQINRPDHAMPAPANGEVERDLRQKAEKAAKTFQENNWLESAASQTFQDVVLTDAEQAELQMWERIRAHAREVAG